MFILEILYATAIFFSNPINLFPIYESIYKLKPIHKSIAKFTKKKQYFVKYFIRVMVILFCFFCCLFIPNFIKFIAFVGSFIYPIVGLYIPLMLNYSYFKKKGTLTRKKKIYLFSLIIGGVFIFTSATIQSLT